MLWKVNILDGCNSAALHASGMAIMDAPDTDTDFAGLPTNLKLGRRIFGVAETGYPAIFFT